MQRFDAAALHLQCSACQLLAWSAKPWQCNALLAAKVMAIIPSRSPRGGRRQLLPLNHTGLVMLMVPKVMAFTCFCWPIFPWRVLYCCELGDLQNHSSIPSFEEGRHLGCHLRRVEPNNCTDENFSGTVSQTATVYVSPKNFHPYM